MKRKKEKDTNNPTAGRDKVLRTIQYFSRFYAWYLFRTNNPQSAITPFNNIKKQFSTTRKLLRLGKFIENLKAASVAYDNKNPVDPVLKYLAIGRQLGYAGYLTCDNVAVFDIIGVRKVENLKKLSETAAKAWLSGLACSAVAGVYTLWRLGEKEKTIDRKEGEGVVEAKKVQKYVFFLSFYLSFFLLLGECCYANVCRDRSAARIQLVSDFSDLVVPLATLGYINVDDGLVGLAGTVSSLIGLWSQWKKTA